MYKCLRSANLSEQRKLVSQPTRQPVRQTDLNGLLATLLGVVKLLVGVLVIPADAACYGTCTAIHFRVSERVSVMPACETRALRCYPHNITLQHATPGLALQPQEGAHQGRHCAVQHCW